MINIKGHWNFDWRLKESKHSIFNPHSYRNKTLDIFLDISTKCHQDYDGINKAV